MHITSGRRSQHADKYISIEIWQKLTLLNRIVLAFIESKSSPLSIVNTILLVKFQHTI